MEGWGGGAPWGDGLWAWGMSLAERPGLLGTLYLQARVLGPAGAGVPPLLACFKSESGLGMSAAAFPLRLCFLPPHLVSLVQAELWDPVLHRGPSLDPLPMLGDRQVTAAALHSSHCPSFRKCRPGEMLLSMLSPLLVALRMLRDFPLGGLVSSCQTGVTAVGRSLLIRLSPEDILPRRASVLQWKEPSLLLHVSAFWILLLPLVSHVGFRSQPCLVQLLGTVVLHLC